ncbi:MAG: ABC transporter ATP-binding protein [Acidimicrobiales bacterium]
MTHDAATARRYVTPYGRALGAGAGLTLVAVAVNLAQPWPMRYVIDDVLQAEGGPPTNASWRLALAVACLLGLIIVGAFVDYWATRLLSSAGLNIANDLRVDVLDRLQTLSLRYHSAQRVGDLVARVTTDTGYAQDMIVQVLATLLPNLALVIGMFAVMVSIDPLFTLLAILATPPLFLATHRSRRELQLAARRVRKADGALASSATESLGAVHLVQAFTLERDRLRRFSALSDDSLDAGLESIRLQARLGPLVDIAGAFSTGLVLWFGANRVLDGRLTIGVLLVFVSYLGSLYKPIKSLSKLANVVSKGRAATERIVDVMSTPPEIVDRPTARPLHLRGSVELRDVSFSYGREPVLDRLSLRIEPGQTAAIVGPTGAGKSTIASLVPRLMDVDLGAVLVDGVDVRDHQLSSLRSQVGFVLQDTLLLEGTLRENIVCARPGVREEDVRRAARLALVDEFSCRLPDGLDTRIGERGANLSGGQRQRVAIARAILRDSPIVILDEPTSALDAASEELIVAALDNLPKDRTRIVIAHRLSTIRDADVIFVLKGGRLVESGTHEALAGSGGLYARLHEFQAGTRPAVRLGGLR